jgi:hypothetical protein
MMVRSWLRGPAGPADTGGRQQVMFAHQTQQVAPYGKAGQPAGGAGGATGGD